MTTDWIKDFRAFRIKVESGFVPPSRSSLHVILVILLGAGITACGAGGSISGIPVQAPQPEAPAQIVLGEFLSGQAGKGLDEGDRQRAYNAQIQAASSGKRTQWKAERSDAYGYVEVAAPRSSASGECRTYQHVIYSGGRSQRGSGDACQSASGAWGIVS